MSYESERCVDVRLAIGGRAGARNGARMPFLASGRRRPRASSPTVAKNARPLLARPALFPIPLSPRSSPLYLSLAPSHPALELCARFTKRARARFCERGNTRRRAPSPTSPRAPTAPLRAPLAREPGPPVDGAAIPGARCPHTTWVWRRPARFISGALEVTPPPHPPKFSTLSSRPALRLQKQPPNPPGPKIHYLVAPAMGPAPCLGSAG